MASVGKIFLSSEPTASASTFKDALVMAYGEDNADQILRHDQWRTISERVKPETFASVLRDERPEAVAMALSQLPPRFAADVLARLPEELRAEAVDNLAYAESAPRSALDAILRAVEESFSGKAGSEEGNQKAGAKRAAAMLNQLDSDSATAIVSHIRNRDAKRASAIEEEMFHFADLLDPRQSLACRRCSPRPVPNASRSRSRASPTTRRPWSSPRSPSRSEWWSIPKCPRAAAFPRAK